jgi:LmbE family N-acetylglucosaminyl deacetylase
VNLESTKNVYIPQTIINNNSNRDELSNILSRTTHLCIAAHYDDVEIMAFNGIWECYESNTNFFTAVIVTDGLGGEKNGIYKNFTDEEFINTRKEEQKKAAHLGKYNAVIFLEYSSLSTKDINFIPIDNDLSHIIDITKPHTIYTHSPFDFHITHLAVVSRVIGVLSNLKERYICQKIIGCEVWGSLDWLPQERKILLDVSQNINLQSNLIKVFDSQISRGKDFAAATLARRKANATFQKTMKEDSYKGITLAVLLNDTVVKNISLEDFVDSVFREYAQETSSRLSSIYK